MKKNLLTLALFFGLALSATAGGGNLKTTQLKGKVLDQSGEPLAGVKVHLNAIDQDSYTDFDGNFVIENVPLKAQKIELELISFEKKEILIDAQSLNSKLQLQLRSR